MKFIYGSESYLIDQELKKYIDIDNVEPIIYSNNEPIDEIMLDMSTASMFFENKLIIIKNHSVLDSKTNSDEFIDLLKETQTDIIFIKETDKLDKKSKLINFLLDNAEVKEIKAVNSRQMISFVKDAISRKGGTIDNMAAIELVNMLPEDLRIVMTEIEKLLMETNHITMPQIKKSVGEYHKDDYFALSNAIVSLDSHGIIDAFNKRKAMGEEPTVIIAQISSVLTLALNVWTLKKQGMSLQDISDKMKIHIFRVKKSNELLQNLKGQSIEGLIKDLANLDYNIKSGKVDPLLGLENFIIKLIK